MARAGRADPHPNRGFIMGERWEKPTFQGISVNGECTAYSGQGDAPGADARPSDTAARSPVAPARAATRAPTEDRTDGPG